MKISRIALALSLVTMAAQSATASPKVYFENSGNMFSRDYLTNGKIKVKPGILQNYDLTPFANGDSVLQHEVDESNDWAKWGRVYYWTSLGFLLGALIISAGNYDTNTRVGILEGGLIGGIGFIFPLGNAVAKSRYHMHRAINYLNGLPLEKLNTESQTTDPDEGLKISLNGLAYSF